MINVYLIAPGTPVTVSRNGQDFQPHTLRQQLQFTAPIVTTADELIFADGSFRVRVARADVILSRFDGLGGTNQFGV